MLDVGCISDTGVVQAQASFKEFQATSLALHTFTCTLLLARRRSPLLRGPFRAQESSKVRDNDLVSSDSVAAQTSERIDAVRQTLFCTPSGTTSNSSA